MNPQQRAFLAAFRETGNVRRACEVANVGRSSHYRWLKEDPEYHEAVELAKEDATDQGGASSHGQVTSRRKDQRMKAQRSKRQEVAANDARSEHEPSRVELVAGAIKKLDEDGESPFGEIRHPKKRAFLCAYSLLGSKLRASEAAGINKSLIYTRGWLNDQQFQDAVERARKMAVDVFEDEATRRAVEGWEEPVGWYKGKAGGRVRRFSDTVLIFRLKGELPQKYAEKLQLSGGLATLNLDALPDDLLERIARGEHPMSVLASAVERGLSRKELGLLPAKDK